MFSILRSCLDRWIWKRVYLLWTHEAPDKWFEAFMGSNPVPLSKYLYLDTKRSALKSSFAFPPCSVFGCLRVNEAVYEETNVCQNCNLLEESFLSFDPRRQVWRSKFEIKLLYLKIMLGRKVIIEIPKAHYMRDY